MKQTIMNAALALCASAAFSSHAAETKPVRFILAGDSTMATASGYGDAFCARVIRADTCINLAKGGRSSGSFRAEGRWDEVQGLLKGASAYRATYVLIQFGHNDQPGKPGRSTDLVTEFPVNMTRYVQEVKAAGAIPVLVTPLTRRSFKNKILENNLAPWATAIRKVALEQQAALLDLNADSYAAVQAMGEDEADTLAVEAKPATPPATTDLAKIEPAGAAKSAFDYTHVGPKGAQFFARMVERELKAALPVTATQFRPEGPSAAQDSGTAAGPGASSGTSRPQLTAAQAAQFTYKEVLKYVGAAGSERLDPWDPLADPLAKGSAFTPTCIVDAKAQADGIRTFNTVQAAVSRALTDAGQRQRTYILVKPGTYHELVYIPPSATAITLYGEGKQASDTVITAKLDAAVAGHAYAAQYGPQFAQAHADVQAMYAVIRERAATGISNKGNIGTGGSQTMWVQNHGFQARNLTIANGYNKDTGNAREECGERPCGRNDVNPQQNVVHHQAVALQVEGADKVQFENVRLIGFQDTLYLKNRDVHQRQRDTVRSFFHHVYVEGDVDYIFGDSTAYFLKSEIRTLGDRSTAYVGAPNTSYLSKYGFVFDQSAFTHDGSKNALAGQFFLARQWFHNQKCTPYGKIPIDRYRCVLGDTSAYAAPQGTITPNVLETVGKMVVMNSRIGRHIDRARPWSDWNRNGTLSYRPAQFNSDDYWANLTAAGIDPVKDLGYLRAPQPAAPFLAEYNNTYE